MRKKNKKCIGIIFGGKSNEHYVSIESAKVIFFAINSRLNSEKYISKCFYINQKGDWFDNFQSELILKEGKNISTLEKTYSTPKFNFLNQVDFNNVDIWFPIIHGINGEDGTIHGLLKLTQKPFVGSGLLGSVLGMDKITMKLIFSYLKIPQVKYFPIENLDPSNKSNLNKLCEIILSQLDLPLFIKPANSGSSLGISKAKNKSDILEGLQKASEVDKRVVVEEGLDIRELECGIIGTKSLIASDVGEVNYTSEWYDYETKYAVDNKIIIPAQIDSKIKQRIQELSIKSCQVLNINTFARVDFFLEKSTNKIFLNEINTIPGFTNKSMFPLLWKASGLEIDQLVAKLIEYCIDFN